MYICDNFLNILTNIYFSKTPYIICNVTYWILNTKEILNKHINTLSLPNNIRHNPSLRNWLRFLRDVTLNSSRGKKISIRRNTFRIFTYSSSEIDNKNDRATRQNFSTFERINKLSGASANFKPARNYEMELFSL